jgi:hypothetical protein
MSDKVFGLSVNQVMAYAAIANVMLVLVLTTINVYLCVARKAPGGCQQRAGGLIKSAERNCRGNPLDPAQTN